MQYSKLTTPPADIFLSTCNLVSSFTVCISVSQPYTSSKNNFTIHHNVFKIPVHSTRNSNHILKPNFIQWSHVINDRYGTEPLRTSLPPRNYYSDIFTLFTKSCNCRKFLANPHTHKHFFKTNMILSPMPRSQKLSLYFRFCLQKFVAFPTYH